MIDKIMDCRVSAAGDNISGGQGICFKFSFSCKRMNTVFALT